ncbi:hypothetical protein [Candidatus Pelagibacter communis]|uniref:hypothetical protein n=1 Tax=Pelagibacter ubique TaxID=198252 RepID=UPI00094D034D|nr:hypothetical protein [Candidatus Pelagibacter ubique]
MKIENIPADIKSKSLKEARDEIDVILAKLESKNLEFNTIDIEYKRLILLNKHVENLFKIKSKNLSNEKNEKADD